MKVRPGSIAAELGVEPGTALLSINGQVLRDALDLQYYEAEETLELETQLVDGTAVIFEIEKGFDDSLGLVPEPDKVRRCTNACPFCFVKGNPKVEKLRTALYVKDDDYRLSFMYGHYVTLTNLREDDWDRIAEQRLSPLYVSVHATDPAARRAMLVNPKSGLINEHLDRLQASNIRCHAQVVLCPGLSDGDTLDRTIRDLYERGDWILSLSIVPVGLTSYNLERGGRPLDACESTRSLAVIDLIRERAERERGFAWCYAADEMFLQAGRDVPGSDYFDERELVGNGVGAMSELGSLVRADLPDLPPMAGQRVLLLTGTSMASYLDALGVEIANASGAHVETVPIENTLYGPMVTTAGLLPGRDFLSAAIDRPDIDTVIFSEAALNDDGLFLDDMPFSELEAALPDVDIWPSEHVTDVLIPA